MKRAPSFHRRVWAACMILYACTAAANDLRVTNISLVHTDLDAGTVDVRFDLSWSNSWRASWTETNTGSGNPSVTVTNWDAAWVFLKWRKVGANWNHAWLAPAGHTAPNGAVIAVGANGGVTNPGAFIYRAANGSGPFSLQNVRLRWNYAAGPASLEPTNAIDVSLHALEMVYIPEGAFYVGSGSWTNHAYSWTVEPGPFTDGVWTQGIHTTTAFRVTSEGELTISNAPGYLWAVASIGPSGVLSNAFPKGYGSFYCMKYEITQGQYTDFLNRLPSAHAAARYPGSTSYRQTIATNEVGFYTNGAPDRALNFLSWRDASAYADWAALRPMTELEFEKVCRGPAAPLPNEFAWGAKTYTELTSESGDVGSGTETVLPAGANVNYQGPLSGPVRAGIYATNNSTRARSGAGYYGVMELSDNVHEQAVTVGNTTGRGFMGTHGDGFLSAGGDADAPSWPGTGGTGAGLRGASYDAYIVTSGTISSRGSAATAPSSKGYKQGFRAVRTAP